MQLSNSIILIRQQLQKHHASDNHLKKKLNSRQSFSAPLIAFVLQVEPPSPASDRAPPIAARMQGKKQIPPTGRPNFECGAVERAKCECSIQSVTVECGAMQVQCNVEHIACKV